MKILLKYLLIFVVFFCSSSIFVFGQCSFTVNAGNDVDFCNIGTGQLNATVTGAGTSTPTFQWNPTTGLNNSTIHNPTVNILTTTTYTVTATLLDNANLITNGDFEAGNTGFTTGHTLGTGGTWGLLSNNGTYAVTTNSNLVHNNFVNCPDHTPSGTNMLVLNSSSTANTSLWCQSVTVTPNTTYQFSYWGMSTVSSSPGQLYVEVNNSIVSPVAASLPSTTCNWQEITFLWNSGSLTTANFCIMNQNLAMSGNDLAIDDISLHKICMDVDTVTYTVNQFALTSIDTTICQGDSIFAGGMMQTTSGSYLDTLMTVGGCDSFLLTTLTVTPISLDLGNDTMICDGNVVLLDATTLNATYFWQDSSTAPTFPVTTSGSYSVSLGVGGCTVQDTIQITVHDVPIVNLGNDTLFCGMTSLILDATNPNSTYLWQDNTTNSTLTAMTSGNYVVTVTNLNGCVAQDDINLIFNPQPVVDLGNDTIICQGTSLILNAINPSATYLWSNNLMTNSIVVNTTDMYSVVVTIGACSAVDSIMITSAPNPIIDLGNDTILCNNPNYLIDATIPNGTYLWQDGTTNAIFNADTSGTYQVVVTDLNGCSGQDMINVVLSESPMIDLGQDSTYCNTSSVNLDAIVSGGITYFWNDSSTNSSLNVTTDGTYEVSVTNTYNCVGTDEITIFFVESAALELGNDTILCEGNVLELDAFIQGATSYTWQDGSPFPDYQISAPGKYFVTVEHNSGCGGSDTIVVGFAPELFVTLPTDTVICEEETITLNAYQPNVVNYHWEGLSAYYGQNDPNDTTFIVTFSGLYQVIVSNGCIDLVQQINVEKEDCGCYPFLPNAFTPNGDGNNDHFKIYSPCALEDLTLRIYDRWGNMVFYTTDPQAEWDGSFKGDNLMPGVYIWQLSYKAPDNSNTLTEFQRTGDITIVR